MLFNDLFRKTTVQEDLIKSCFNFYEELSKNAELILAEDSSNGGNNNVELLQKLGFSSSVEVKTHNFGVTSYTRLKEFLEFYVSSVNHFGPDTIVVPTNLFLKVLLKKKLISGCFSDYTGSVPETELHLIEECTKKLETFKYKLGSNIGIANLIDEQEGYRVTDYLINCVNAFPFVLGSVSSIEWISTVFGEGEINNFNHFRLSGKSVSDKFFIAAPTSEFSKNRINMIKVNRYVKPVPSFSTDPIIFRPTSYGCLCITSWGEEKNIPLLIKFREVSTNIQNKLNEKR